MFGFMLGASIFGILLIVGEPIIDHFGYKAHPSKEKPYLYKFPMNKDMFEEIRDEEYRKMLR